MRNWPSAAVTPIICCRPGDPHLTPAPGSQSRQCYCCDVEITASPTSQKIKENSGEGAEFICIECWAEKLKHSTVALVWPKEDTDLSN